MECVLQVLITVLKHFVVLRQIVDEVLHEVEIISVEGRQLNVLEVSSICLGFAVLSLAGFLWPGRSLAQIAFSELVTVVAQQIVGLTDSICLKPGCLRAVNRVFLEYCAMLGASAEGPCRIAVLLGWGFCPLIALGL